MAGKTPGRAGEGPKGWEPPLPSWSIRCADAAAAVRGLWHPLGGLWVAELRRPPRTFAAAGPALVTPPRVRSFLGWSWEGGGGAARSSRSSSSWSRRRVARRHAAGRGWEVGGDSGQRRGGTVDWRDLRQDGGIWGRAGQIVAGDNDRRRSR
jgi:hypothetical protein